MENAMSLNPFEGINQRFDRLESLLLKYSNPMKIEPPQVRYFDIEGASEFIGIPKQTLYQKCSKREIKHTKAGRHLKFLESDLIEYLESNRRKTTQELEAKAAFDLSQKVKKNA